MVRSIRSAAFDGRAIEKLSPGGARLIVHLVEIPACDFLVEVGPRAVLAHKRDADLEQDFALLAEVEPGAGVLALRRNGASAWTASSCHTEDRGRRLVESTGDVDLVVRVGAAEAPRARPAGKSAVGFELDVIAKRGEFFGRIVLVRGWSSRCCRRSPASVRRRLRGR